MKSIEIVDVATARAARGVRIVAPGNVASPWSEAAKGLFRVQGVPVLVARFARNDADLAAWMRADNVPVVFHDDEPPRTHWAAITTLAARLGPPGRLLPEDLERRARVMGLLNEIAGEDGLGWNARLLMIHGSLASGGERGFPLPVAQYLAARYGYAPERIGRARERVLEVLAALAAPLRQGREHIEGDAVGALDVYAATFLLPFRPIQEADCPRMLPAVRAAFAFVAEELGDAVPPELAAHRTRMYERHLGWPIDL